MNGGGQQQGSQRVLDKKNYLATFLSKAYIV